MFRWDDVEAKTIDGMTIKMYREPYEAIETQKVPNEKIDIDHIAHKHLGTETFMYKILDTNFIELMENRFNMDKVDNIYVPIKEKIV
jgi:hypothetical protein